jgi:hypothetical protein
MELMMTLSPFSFTKNYLKDRITFVKGDTACGRLLDHVNPFQLEAKFGGFAEDFEGEYWPPKIPNEYFLTFGGKANQLMDEPEYFYDFVMGDLDSMNLNNDILNGF